MISSPWGVRLDCEENQLPLISQPDISTESLSAAMSQLQIAATWSHTRALRGGNERTDPDDVPCSFFASLLHTPPSRGLWHSIVHRHWHSALAIAPKEIRASGSVKVEGRLSFFSHGKWPPPASSPTWLTLGRCLLKSWMSQDFSWTKQPGLWLPLEAQTAPLSWPWDTGALPMENSHCWCPVTWSHMSLVRFQGTELGRASRSLWVQSCHSTT